jgi:hypothetical protein
MTLIDGYTQTLLLPQLQSLALSKRQQAIVVEDVSRRLKSLLCHRNDLAFRRTILILGTEEASFWGPQTANLEIRSLVVVAVRNSLIEDLGASRPYTKMLESRKKQLRDEQMPSITSEATKYFEAADLDVVRFQPDRDLFGDLPRRFPNALNYLLSPTYLARRNPLIQRGSCQTGDPPHTPRGIRRRRSLHTQPSRGDRTSERRLGRSPRPQPP